MVTKCPHCGVTVTSGDKYEHERPDGRVCRKAMETRVPDLLASMGCAAGTGAPNLDAQSASDLGRAWFLFQQVDTTHAARIMFPSKPKGYMKATRDLGSYAINLSTAKSCREKGNITAAGIYEKIAEQIFEGLPPFARW